MEISASCQELILRMLQLQRHDWLNHIQVLDGLLKIESYQQLQQYINQITLQLQQEQYVSLLGDRDLILYLFTYTSKYPSIQFELEISEAIPLHTYAISSEQLAILMQLLDGVAEHCIHNNDLLPNLLLRVGKLEDKVQFVIDYVGSLNETSFAPLWETIKAQWMDHNTTMNEREKNETEWLIEIIMG